ncbi:hypothetical protein L7F22_058809 [Adiantum nelumboides]|nr:hypothetical protein [Adiantum nelumboides]
MGTTLKFSSSFRPQTDGQSEEANSTVLDLLKCYVSEHKATWELYLSLVGYAYNNTVHTSTGKVPFEIVKGGKKVPPILQTKDKIFEADKYVQNTHEAYRMIKLALEKTQSKQKKAADRHCRKLIFSLGDWILLRFEKARLRKMKGKEHLFPKSKDLVPKEQREVEELDEIFVPEQILAHKERKVRGKVARRYLLYNLDGCVFLRKLLAFKRPVLMTQIVFSLPTNAEIVKEALKGAFNRKTWPAYQPLPMVCVYGYSDTGQHKGDFGYLIIDKLGLAADFIDLYSVKSLDSGSLARVTLKLVDQQTNSVQ